MAEKAENLLVVGGVTLDTIHLPGRERPLIQPGGAGLYTASGAWAARGNCTLFAQRPDPFPEVFSTLSEVNWIGPLISAGDLPRLEIAHYGGGRAELVSADWGAQLWLSTDDLPDDLTAYSVVHIAALGPTDAQLAFARSAKARGARAISAGTYARAVYGEPEKVRELLAFSDYFFMNENEARGLYGSPEAVQAALGQKIFVTRGAAGASAYLGSRSLQVSAPQVAEMNPTGAGDMFCGAVLAGLLSGLEVMQAMVEGGRLASAHVASL